MRRKGSQEEAGSLVRWRSVFYRANLQQWMPVRDAVYVLLFFYTYETYLPPAVFGNSFVGRNKAKTLCTLLQHMKLIFSLMALKVNYEFSFLLSEHA